MCAQAYVVLSVYRWETPCDVLLVHYLGTKRVNTKVVKNGRRQCFTWKDFGNYLKAQSLWRKTTWAAVARKQWPNTAVCIPLQTEWFLSPTACTGLRNPAAHPPANAGPKEEVLPSSPVCLSPGFSLPETSTDLRVGWVFRGVWGFLALMHGCASHDSKEKWRTNWK